MIYILCGFAKLAYIQYIVDEETGRVLNKTQQFYNCIKQHVDYINIVFWYHASTSKDYFEGMGQALRQMSTAKIEPLFTYYTTYTFWSASAPPENGTKYALKVIENMSLYANSSFVNRTLYIQYQQQCQVSYNATLCSCMGKTQFYLDFLETMKKNGIYNLGVMTTKTDWAACDGTEVLKDYRIYYIQQSQDECSFDDFESFGGWTTPGMKLVQSQIQICSGEFQINYLGDF